MHVDVADVDLNDLDESDYLLMDERFILNQSLRADMKIVIAEIGNFVLPTIMGQVAMHAERKAANEAGENAPPVMPAELVKEIIGRHMNPLNMFSTADASTRPRRSIAAYRNERNFQSSIDGHDHTTEFNDAWRLFSAGGRFELMSRFCVGLATALPNTTSFESDFCILKWEKDAYRENLLDLSLEGIFHAKQFDLLGSL
ncbi:hypothetical protein H310_15024 [Aphanomyces invadans]|uniref:Uncharacterized protein n=1 Tax=Aphanomyces invadans TaxID=157072 RepID=A0A024T7X7_9STRA|nr:hypothetical protein H310_15024 [Aphanomyces invadans]ETV90140.1 hypothetical protein H310_15024 [Aphanomyces invadans]|eukprot:XP_008881226.1 hypothetical protein H310_15024 [Aphanomyces invadans]